MEQPDNDGVELSPAERAVCEGLRGRHDARVTVEVLDAARRHRVHLVLAASHPPVVFADPAMGAALRREEQVAAVLDVRREDETRRLLDALGDAQIDVLVFKGAALAHTVYAAPHLRPRTDVDLLVDRESLDGADRVLAACGWHHPPEPEPETFAAQRHYVKQGTGRMPLLVDLHWRIANPRVFADVLPFAELHRRAVTVPTLGRGALTPSPVDALFLACIHRVAHHEDAIDLLWLWDIHLLTSRLGDDERATFAALAARTSMTAVSHRGIACAAQLFDSPGSAELLALLHPGADEPSAKFLGGVRPATVFATDFTSLPTWRARVRLAAEHLFPSRAYMRTRYSAWPPFLVPLAYVDRIVRGAPKWFRRDASSGDQRAQ